MQDIRTEDDVIVHEGDRVYNYYDMWPGTIVIDSIRNENHHQLGRETDLRTDLWFDVQRDDGDEFDIALLNGQRICSIAHARRMGWKGV